MKTIKIPQATAKGYIECPEGGVFDASYQSSKTRRGRTQGGGLLCPALTAAGSESNLILIDKIQSTMTKEELIEPYIAMAREAKDNDLVQDFVEEKEQHKNYEAFLCSLMEDSTKTEEDKQIIHDAFAKYLNRPEGKGWCFDFNQCKWYRIRKLTPREAFRLMDVREENIDKLMQTHINKKGKEEQVISNSQLYKMAGNSICVNPMYLTFRNVFFPTQKKFEEGEQLSLF